MTSEHSFTIYTGVLGAMVTRVCLHCGLTHELHAREGRKVWIEVEEDAPLPPCAGRMIEAVRSSPPFA